MEVLVAITVLVSIIYFIRLEIKGSKKEIIEEIKAHFTYKMEIYKDDIKQVIENYKLDTDEKIENNQIAASENRKKIDKINMKTSYIEKN